MKPFPSETDSRSGPGPAAEAAAKSCADEGQEVDVWLGAYSARAMAPSFLLCAAATLAVVGAAAWLAAADRLPGRSARLCVYGAAGVIWLTQLLRVGYRTIFFNYRVTNRRVFRDRGLRRPADGEMELRRLASIRVERGPWERWLDVGRVRLVPEPGVAPLALEGVRQPGRVAELIRAQAERAKQAGRADGQELTAQGDGRQSAPAPRDGVGGTDPST